jgi:4-hydroxybenzoate polyprenyltransferase
MALVALLPLLGFSFAYWDHGCTVPGYGAVPTLILLAMLWAVPHMGTMWLNAALDRDEGAVLFGERAAPPAHIERYAYATLALAVGTAFARHLGLGLCVLGCALLSVLYSHPRTAWKGHAVLGPASNALGYGILSPLGGWIVADLPPTARGLAVLGVSVTFILSAYLAAQAFQEEEDRARGYRTLVALRGARATLSVTRALLSVSILLTLGLAVLGWFPRSVLVSLPAFLATDHLVARWREQPGGGDESWARAFFRRLTIAGLLCLAAVSAHFAWTQHEGLPLGGLGTASGHPSVRVCR